MHPGLLTWVRSIARKQRNYHLILDSNSQFFSVGNNDRRTPDDGSVRRLGFRAEIIRLDGDTWEAEKLRVTNDPFSPPELELVTDRATLKPLSETQDQLKTENPRLVFDQKFSIPLFRDTIIIDKYSRDLPAKIGFDTGDKDGLYYQHNFDVVSEENLNLRISPQILFSVVLMVKMVCFLPKCLVWKRIRS
jgi:hypothetical protein